VEAATTFCAAQLIIVEWLVSSSWSSGHAHPDSPRRRSRIRPPPRPAKVPPEGVRTPVV